MCLSPSNAPPSRAHLCATKLRGNNKFVRFCDEDNEECGLLFGSSSVLLTSDAANVQIIFVHSKWDSNRTRSLSARAAALCHVKESNIITLRRVFVHVGNALRVFDKFAARSLVHYTRVSYGVAYSWRPFPPPLPSGKLEFARVIVSQLT